MDIAIIVGLLAGGIFLLYMARWLFSEHLLGKAIAAALFGALVLGATFLRVIPALTDTENVKLNERIAALAKESGALKSDKTKLEAETKKLTAEQTAAAKQLADLDRRRSEELEAIQGDLVDLRSRLNEPATGIAVDRAAVNDRADRADQVRAEIRGLSSFRVKPAQAAAAPVTADQTKELTQLRDKMSAKMTTPSYDVEVYPDKEMVRGRQGRYYVVDLKNATSGVRYFFPGGKYTLSAGDKEFRSSLNTFVADILSKFDGKVRYDLYVRGNADVKPYEGRLEPGFEFRQIKYVRSLGGDKYGVDMAQHDVGDTISNKDLPDLRAAFMQKLIADAYPVKKPIILEGSVTAKTDDRDRNAELIMFVDW